MRIVMKFRSVEVTCNGVTTLTQLNTVADALLFVNALEKVQAKRDVTKLPSDFTEQLRLHLEKTGTIHKQESQIRKERASERLMFLAKTLHTEAGRVNA